MAPESSARVATSRRGFLRIGRRTVEPARRPPWAIDEALFVDRCTRCDRCIETCPTQILVRMDGGFPGVDFSRGECTFCGDCVSVCEPRALLRGDAAALPWTLVAAIGADCLAVRGVECRVCGEVCPERAIRFRLQLGGVAHPVLDAGVCTGCGACIGPCPARAIAMQSDNNIPTERET
ncbi:ferredoxin-type protein NapF [Thauera sp.]|uniref:ferredoxin-type protein NapF n=1 Tax=Thauera sp. TaxID=1905334 RepID=UPI002A372371|nr:ferredoxin-type protein NapF [Thauera sp.]MDX9886699.1 ferredoxin-type protein NapF [Thauera sp.]